MKVKVLATVMAVAFVMSASGTAEAKLFKFKRSNSCGNVSSCGSKCQTVSNCAPKCHTVSTCAPKATCCAAKANCCATRTPCSTGCATGCGTVGGCAPAAGGTAPESKDVETIPAPPTKNTEPPKPGAKPDSEA